MIFKDPFIVGEDQGADEQSRNQEPANKDVVRNEATCDQKLS